MNITSEKSPDANIKISNFRRALPQILAVSVKNVLLLGFGMTLGFPTILIPSLSGDNPDETIALDQDAISWIGSVNLLCVPLGCLLSGIITQPLGRKRSMQFVNLPFLAAWLLFYYSKESWQVFLALCMTGVSGGLLEAPVLTFIAEITEPNMRGALSSTSTLSVNLGVFISFLLGSFLNWRTMALVNTSVPVLAFVLFAFIPESPYWLVSKNKQREAKKSLAWLRGWTHTDNVTEEYLEILDSLEKTPMTTKSKGKEFVKQQVKMYCKSNFLKPFFLIMLAFYIGHFGNSSITVYAINIFNAFQVPINSYYATIYIGLVQLVGVTICTFCIRYIGKRKLTFISLAGVALSFLASGIYSYIFDVTNFTNHPRSSQQAYTWIPLLTLLAQAFFAYLGIKQLPWNLLGEVFNNDVRAMASGISAAGAYIIHFIANKIFLDLMEVVTLPGIFWIYSVTACLGAVALYFLLPETEGKSLAEIIDHYNGKAKLNNKIGRRRRNVCGEANEAFKEEVSTCKAVFYVK